MGTDRLFVQIYHSAFRYIFKKSYLCIVWCPLLCWGQKNDYNTYIEYRDAYLDKILNPERLIHSGSNLIFYGDVKNVYIKHTGPDGSVQSAPFQNFYDRSKVNYKSATYNSRGQLTQEMTYYSNTHHTPFPIIQSYINIYNDTPRVVVHSYIDTSKQLIVHTKTYLHNHLSETDTLYYTGDFKLTEKRSYNTLNQLQSIYKAAYLPSGLLYKTATRTTSTNINNGIFYKYDQQGRFLYSQHFGFDSYDAIHTDYEDTTSTKAMCIRWLDATDFEMKTDRFHCSFSYKDKVLTTVYTTDNTSKTIYFNDQLLPIKSLYVDNNSNMTIIIHYTYNPYGDVVTENVTLKTGKLSQTTSKIFQYQYDQHHNWTERIHYEDKQPVEIITRAIEYF